MEKNNNNAKITNLNNIYNYQNIDIININQILTNNYEFNQQYNDYIERRPLY